ncbi:hypothetical protein SCLCIDRAFT_132374, partial [Scleroderma citrinum Foug A]
SGIGKSTLINRAFGIKQALTADDRPGTANIEEALESPENERFILHDSQGFESGDDANYAVAKNFIQKRKVDPDVSEQLHAIWLCFQIPLATHGERFMERGTEAFLKEKKKISLTQTDRGEFKEMYQQLIKLTSDLVSEYFKPRMGLRLSAVPVVTAMAQRVAPRLKIVASIRVGKSRYWRALFSTPEFFGYTVEACLCVIHTDIVNVWNFHDPSNVRASHRCVLGCYSFHAQYLMSKRFQDIMVRLVEDAAPDPPLNSE